MRHSMCCETLKGPHVCTYTTLSQAVSVSMAFLAVEIDVPVMR